MVKEDAKSSSSITVGSPMNTVTDEGKKKLLHHLLELEFLFFFFSISHVNTLLLLSLLAGNDSRSFFNKLRSKLVSKIMPYLQFFA